MLQVIALFQEIRQAALGNVSRASTNGKVSRAEGAGNGSGESVLAELCAKSKFLLAVQYDIKHFDVTIKGLIDQIITVKLLDMAHLCRFVRQTDIILDQLTDEGLVLKAFSWPRKYSTYREAKALFEEVTQIKNTFLEWQLPTKKSPTTDLEDMRNFTVSNE